MVQPVAQFTSDILFSSAITGSPTSFEGFVFKPSFPKVSRSLWIMFLVPMDNKKVIIPNRPTWIKWHVIKHMVDDIKRIHKKAVLLSVNLLHSCVKAPKPHAAWSATCYILHALHMLHGELHATFYMHCTCLWREGNIARSNCLRVLSNTCHSAFHTRKVMNQFS